MVMVDNIVVPVDNNDVPRTMYETKFKIFWMFRMVQHQCFIAYNDPNL